MTYTPGYVPPANSLGSTTASLATVSLVFGILSWCVLPFIGAIVAIVCGHMARSEIRRAPAGTVIQGDGMAIAGLVLGYIHLAIVLLVVIVAILFFGVLFMHAGLHGLFS